ncbi:hypothetical protein LCGC14_0406220 [marine sediment metagenome]|uniref:Uncharacterized protein n=1 Tax=marine sediment metagenome TaxID=412755 RepID=A0A0F9W4G0_9ZZZZ
MKKGSLEGLALDRIKELLEVIERSITRECADKGEELKSGTHLCDISVANTDAKRWVRALLEELT